MINEAILNMNNLLTKVITKENTQKNIVCEADFLVSMHDLPCTQKLPYSYDYRQ